MQDTCLCFTERESHHNRDGSVAAGTVSTNFEPAWTGADCSLRTCPRGYAWAATPQFDNNHKQLIECSGKGTCDRKTGECACYDGFWGEGCRPSKCPNECSGHGTCQSLRQFADDYSHNADDNRVSNQFGTPSSNPNTVPNVGPQYDDAWDADYSYGCKCDDGFRGPACDKIECPSTSDKVGGNGNTKGRDCSGRGTCDYDTGLCTCFPGYYSGACDLQHIIV